jgi:hypothetical protein
MDTNPYESPKAAQPLEADAPLPPVALDEVLSRSFTILREAPAVFAIIFVLNIGITAVHHFFIDPPRPAVFGPAEILRYLIDCLFLAWMIGAAVLAAEGRTLQESLTCPLPRSPLTLISLVLYFLMVTVGATLLVIPGIYLAVRFIFTSTSIAAGRSGFDGFARSSRMVRGRWWNVFAGVVLIVLPSLVFTGLQFALIGIDPVAFAKVQWPATAVSLVVLIWTLAASSALFLAAERGLTPAPPV